MNARFSGILCTLTGLTALVVTCLFSSCKKENGTGSSGPVSRARTQNTQNQKTAKLDPGLLRKLKDANQREREVKSLLAPQLQDQAKSLGLEFSLFRDAVADRYFFPEVMGAGIAWLDFDLDGYWDLYLGNGDQLVGPSTHQNQVFRNQAGTQFENVTISAATDGRGFTQGLAAGDANGDGFEDLFVSGYGQNYLMINQGDGSFERQDVGDIKSEPQWSASCIQADFDGDGDLDIFVASYVDWTVENHHPCVYKGVKGYCGPGTYGATQDLLYQNLGDGSYQEVGADRGIDFKTKGLVVCAADFDHDLIPEFYVGSDLTNNAFYKLEKESGRFENLAGDSGLATSKNGQAEATMGFAVRDFDQNGQIDLFLTHYYKNKNTLYLNQGDLLFKDASYESRIKALSFDFIGFGTAPIDYDLDSDFDLFIANGHVLGRSIPPFELTSQIINNSDCRFFDVSARAGEYFEKKFAGRSVARCDFDNDGDTDIAVGHLDQPLALLQNQTQSENNFLQIQLLELDRRDLTGTEVEVQFDDRTVVLPVVRGEGYLSSSDSRLQVGIGQADEVSVTVKWRSGRVSKFERLAGNTTWLLTSEDEAFPDR